MQIIVRNVYRCKICNFALMHSRSRIDSHVKKHHKVTLAEYSAKYEAGQ